MIPMPEIDLSRLDTDDDPFLWAAQSRIRDLVRLRQGEINMRKTIDAQIARYDDQIANAESEVEEYIETGQRTHLFQPDDEKIVRQETKKIVNETRIQANQRLLPAVEQQVQAPDGWGKTSRIDTKGHVVVTLKSADPICPSQHEVERQVKNVLDELRENQSIRFCLESLIVENEANIPPWDVDRQAKLKQLQKDRPATPQGP